MPAQFEAAAVKRRAAGRGFQPGIANHDLMRAIHPGEPWHVKWRFVCVAERPLAVGDEIVQAGLDPHRLIDDDIAHTTPPS